MTSSSLGDMRQHLQLMRHNTALKTRLNTLVQELSTGQKSDLTAHLGSDQTRVSSIDRQLQMLQGLNRSNTQTSQLLGTMQMVLAEVEERRSGAAQTLMSISEASNLGQIEEAGRASRSSFEGTVSLLNTRFGERALFGGRDFGTTPLAPASDMLDALRTAIAGETTTTGVKAVVQNWFNMAGGGFETMGYQGDIGDPFRVVLGADQTMEVGARADDPAFRDMLEALALGALAGDPTVALSQSQRSALQRSASESLMSAAAPLTGVQSSLGHAEALVEQTGTRMAAKATSLGMARNDLLLADPFDTATMLQNLQVQLETHYTLTARLSRLSLTEYLR